MYDITLPINKFSVDGIKTTYNERYFDGEDINLGTSENPVSLQFKRLSDEKIFYEKSAQLSTFLFNGSCVLTPYAISDTMLGINEISYDSLHAETLVLRLEESCIYDLEETKKLFASVDLSSQYIIIFYTSYMQKYSDLYLDGIPSSEFWDKQKKRPYFTQEAAQWIVDLGIAKCFVIDNVSFEGLNGSKDFFPVTTTLMNVNENSKTFIPLVYHAKISEEIYMLSRKNQFFCSIELGNTPEGILPGYSVKIHLM